MKQIVDAFNILKRKVKDKISYKALTKESLIEKIYNCSKRHAVTLSAMSALNKDEMNVIHNKIINHHDIDKLFSFVNDFRNKLVGNAASLERESFLQSVKEVNRGFIRMLEDLLVNIDKVVEEDEITILNSRISIYSLMGLLKQSEIVGIYSQFLFGLVTELCVSDIVSTPKYRIIYLASNKDIFTQAIIEVCNTRGTYSFLKDLNIIRRKGVDYKLDPTDENSTVLTVARGIDYPKGFTFRLSLFSVFSDIWHFVGERCIRYKSMKMERIEISKDWMENRVALIKLDMSNNTNDAEKYRLEKITSKYENMISKLDKKLADYHTDD